MVYKFGRTEIETYGFAALFVECSRWGLWADRQDWAWARAVELHVDKDEKGFTGLELWAGPLHLQLDFFRKAERRGVAHG